MQNQTEHPVFRALADNPDRASNFAKAMMFLGKLPGYSPRYLIDNFPWGSGNLTVVDVGGGIGHIAQALVAHHPSVQCIV